jgi:hypothetical protein
MDIKLIAKLLVVKTQAESLRLERARELTVASIHRVAGKGCSRKLSFR